ncbi:hypothetical protein NEHOM01_2010 [Nematocida homosporus]|uniref:uncharacterized protein n=1 Tax=Nematocida homosporus TaxID=1912981 RepID=UPI00221E91F2|nr:uncharacterized protein NEHOM01_2010 [Nematocida homosporus]KAI5187212.1 hypothetical protein NEHOM01_2010 [Nematocida homosporus]
MAKRSTRRLSILGSMKDFSKYFLDEILTAGQGDQHQKYTKHKMDLNGVDIKETNKPHRPELEVLFLCMICLLCTLIFKCSFFFTSPVLFDLSGSNIWSNILIGIIVAISSGLAILYRINVSRGTNCTYIYY